MASRSLGTLTLDLIAKIGGFEAGMTKAERASSRASKKIADDAEKAAAKSKAAFKAIGLAVAAAFGGLSAIGVFSSVIDNTKLMEKEQAQLAAVLKSTGEVAGYSRDQLNGMATALSNKSLFSTGEINQAQTALLAFTGVLGEEFVRAQQSAADMSARTGMSIQQTTELIGRALDVPSQGMASLSRQGFRFSDDQKALMQQLEATGKTAEAQGIILDALEESYGGAALAARNTFGGAIDAVRNTLGGLATGKEGSLEEARLAVEEFNTALSGPEAEAAFSAVVSTITSGATTLVKALTAIPWDLVADGAKVVAAVLATRLVVSVGATAASMALATLESIKYQAALARMSGASTAAAAGLGTLSVAARAATTAMAALGGPVGLAVLAASALTLFSLSATETKKEAQELSSAVDLLNASFEGYTKNQAAAAIDTYTDRLKDAQQVVEKAEARIESLSLQISRFPNSPGIEELQRELRKVQSEADTARQDIEGLTGRLEQLQVIAGSVNVSASIASVSEQYKKLEADLDKQILLIGKKTEAEKLETLINAGLVEGVLAGTGQELIAKQKVIDASKEAEAAEKARESAAKSAASAAANAAKAAIEKAQSEAKAVQESVDALIRQSEQVGWTTEAIALYDLEAKGASETQLKLASAALEVTKAFKEQEQINAEARGVIEGLQTEEEQIRASYERRKELILNTTLKTAEEKAELLKRLEDETNEALLAVSDNYWERYLAAAEKSLTSFDELAKSVVENFSSQFGDAFESMVFDAENLGDAVSGMAESMARSVINALGQMAAQWLAYQVVQMMVGKATKSAASTEMVATAAATSLQAGLAAYASTAAIPVVGPAAAPAAMATALTATTPMVAGISSLSLVGMAHDGIDSIPKTGTWLLEEGERVTPAKTSARLDAVLDRIERTNGSGAMMPNLVINNTGTPQNYSVQSFSRDEIVLIAEDAVARKAPEVVARDLAGNNSRVGGGIAKKFNVTPNRR